MTESLDKFLGELQQEGALTEGASGFTLRSDKAREKLQKFALEHPESYFLLIVGALHTLGGRHFNLRVDADDLEVEAEVRVPRQQLSDLWSYVAGGSKLERAEGLRLLAMAVLTSVRFDSVDWRLESADEMGAYDFIQEIKKGRILDSRVVPSSEEREGTRVMVKRRNLGQVARRFFSQLADRFFSQTMLEQKVLTERLFPGVFESFSLNQKAMDCSLAQSRVIAVGRTPGAPGFLQGESDYALKSDIPVVAVLNDPAQGPSLPGVAGEVTWIWHGLRMGQTSLKLPYQFSRAFVCADHLSTDLGLRSIPDSWEKSRTDRAAREAVRDLLHKLAQDFVSKQPVEQKKSVQPQLETMLLEVIADRIETSRSRQRLASFNRDLIACPLFWASDHEGKERRYTLSEIWERLEAGEKTACFKFAGGVRQVPPWPDRPLVIMGSDQVRNVLDKVFGANRLLNGETVATDVERLLSCEQVVPVAQKPDNCLAESRFSWRGSEVEWILGERSGEKLRGALQVIGNGRVLIQDDTLDLPAGMVVKLARDWLPDYQGKLAQRDEFEALAWEIIGSLASVAATFEGELGARELAVQAALWEMLVPRMSRWGTGKPGFDASWLLVHGADGWKRQSPEQFFRTRPEAPVYRLSLEDAARSFTAHRADTVFLATGPGSFRYLNGLGRRVILSAKVLRRLQEKTPYVLPSLPYWVLSVPDEVLSRFGSAVSRAVVGFPYSGSRGEKLTVQVNLWKHALMNSRVECFVQPATVILDWEDGWPGGKASQFSSDEALEKVHEAAREIMWWAVLELLFRADFSVLEKLHPQSVSSAWFEAWTDGRASSRKLFLTSTGTRVSVDEYLARTPNLFFSNLADRHRIPASVEALWIPAEVCEGLELLSASANWRLWNAPKGVSAQTTAPQIEEKSEERPPLPKAATEQPLPDKPLAPEEVVPESRTSSQPVSPLPEVSKTVEGETAEVEQPDLQDIPDVIPPSPAELVEPEPSRSEDDLPPYHSFLLAEYAALGEHVDPDIRSKFGSFLQGLVWREQAGSTSLLGEEPSLPLGQISQQLADARRETAICVLSALFSVFNRRLEEVQDYHERQFQRALLRRCEDLYLKRPMEAS